MPHHRRQRLGLGVLVTCLVLLSSCRTGDSLTRRIDYSMFTWWGITLFDSPEQVTMKAIHLDSGPLNGKEVVVQGKVIEVGDHASHLILNDDTARMLVVLTDLPDAAALVGKNPKYLRVLGVIERGKKGLPYILAKALIASTEAPGPT